MGVATRGVKFKFSSGEKVLCYEPDPTKAKVLYESKVLDLVVSRDKRGRKVPEYLIHFFGWNSSWDRCVREEFILSFTDENRELQTKLAKEAALSIKGKRRLPPILKEAKKNCEDFKSEKVPVPENVPSSTDSSEEEIEVTIVIPEILKQQLEEDQYCILKKNKLVCLPCHPSVVAILEAFVKYFLAKMLCASAPRNGKKPEDVQNKLSLCKEAMDGIRVTFDFTLPHLLLYPPERRQHSAVAHKRSPQEFIKVEPQPFPSSTPQVKKEDKKPLLHSEPTFKRKRGRPKSVGVRTLRSGRKPLPRPAGGPPRGALREQAGPSSSRRPTRGCPPPLLPSPCPSSSGGDSCREGAELDGRGKEGGAAGLGLAEKARLLRETLQWRMLPPSLYGQATPSLVYGAQHLLRLFVALPDLISKMNICSRKLRPLLSILEQFLAYLCDQREQLFPPSAYADCGK